MLGVQGFYKIPLRVLLVASYVLRFFFCFRINLVLFTFLQKRSTFPFSPSLLSSSCFPYLSPFPSLPLSSSFRLPLLSPLSLFPVYVCRYQDDTGRKVLCCLCCLWEVFQRRKDSSRPVHRQARAENRLWRWICEGVWVGWVHVCVFECMYVHMSMYVCAWVCHSVGGVCVSAEVGGWSVFMHYLKHTPPYLHSQVVPFHFRPGEERKPHIFSVGSFLHYCTCVILCTPWYCTPLC